ncbi:glycoside hydrolase [Zopfochytrium polystomum]|nr:glycoside hydrolase [Zopfochytrium polystomum]
MNPDAPGAGGSGPWEPPAAEEEQVLPDPEYFPKFKPIAKTGADPERLEYIKEMFLHGWSGYKQFAWLKDDLKPFDRTGSNWYPPGSLLATIVDSLSTLHIMGLKDELALAKAAVIERFLPPRTPSSPDVFADIGMLVNVFETTIRNVGGLLSIYDLEGDPKMLEAAVMIADRLAPALNAAYDQVLPLNQLNLQTGQAMGWGVISLAQAGSLQLEFQYLADAMRSHAKITRYPSLIPGIPPLSINPSSEQPTIQKFGVGAEADSYYEYLLKLYVSTGDKRMLDVYHTAVETLATYLIHESADGKYAYIPDVWVNETHHLRPDKSFGHLTCFIGGMFALGSHTTCPHRPAPTHATRLHKSCAARELELAAKITHTCHAAATQSPLVVGHVTERVVDEAGLELTLQLPWYMLRPETVESLFYMWRLTKDVKYRRMGWAMAVNMNKHCRDDVAFHGLRDVFNPSNPVNNMDTMETFFLAETLKYLYLLFTDDSVLPLDEYVFNTEAHPLSIRGHGRRKHVPWGKPLPY